MLTTKLKITLLALCALAACAGQLRPRDESAPRPYRVYTALLTQRGDQPPTAQILENTLGFEPVWQREVEGSYPCIHNGQFKNAVAFINQPVQLVSDGRGVTINVDNDDQVEIRTGTVDGSGSLYDNVLRTTLVEIRVYDR